MFNLNFNVMKKTNVWGLLCLLLVSAFSFVSCSDDEGGIEDAGLIYGVWEPVRAQGYEVIDGDRSEWDYDVDEINEDEYIEADYNRFGFYDDGTCTSWWYTGSGRWEVEYSGIDFSLDGNRLYIGGDYCTVLTLNSTTLVMEIHEVESDYEYYEKVTFRRVE